MLCFKMAYVLEQHYDFASQQKKFKKVSFLKGYLLQYNSSLTLPDNKTETDTDTVKMVTDPKGNLHQSV